MESDRAQIDRDVQRNLGMSPGSRALLKGWTTVLVTCHDPDAFLYNIDTQPYARLHAEPVAPAEKLLEAKCCSPLQVHQKQAGYQEPEPLVSTLQVLNIAPGSSMLSVILY